MPIHVPGKRSRRGHVQGGKRNVVAVLQLTAMVDMFTVMVVFLLQNYATTNQILPLPDKVELPKAASVKELKPSNVVLLSKDGVIFNNQQVASFDQVRAQEDWLLGGLKEKIEQAITEGEEKKKSLPAQIKEAVQDSDAQAKKEDEVDEFRKITIQADRTVDFLSVKKVMYTVTEAGVYEINFAVLKKRDEAAKTN